MDIKKCYVFKSGFRSVNESVNVEYCILADGVEATDKQMVEAKARKLFADTYPTWKIATPEEIEKRKLPEGTTGSTAFVFLGVLLALEVFD